jgi:hypothetical protein
MNEDREVEPSKEQTLALKRQLVQSRDHPIEARLRAFNLRHICGSVRA